MPEFDREQIESRLRGRLEEISLRKKALAEEGENMRDGELADYDQHPGDQATETYEQELGETTAMILDEELDRVQLALRRLESGEYGKCIDCGAEIPAERLEAMPEAVRCIEHQREYEARHRQVGGGQSPRI